MSDDKLMDYMIQRIESMDKKIDMLVAFKWKLLGATGAYALVVGIVIQLIIATFWK